MEKIEIIEGLLYIAGDVGLTEEQLIMHVPVTKQQLQQEIEKHHKPHLEISRHGQTYFLKTTPRMEKYIDRILQDKPKNRLSQAALEVLAIIAYNQPASRAMIEELRGVQSDGPITTLLNKGLIMKKNVENERASHFVTTRTFLYVFGLESLADLPTQDDIQEQEEIDLFFDNLKEEKNDG
ncbi:SMC-Scp complex subunit ScpB [Salinicoccus kekensis]|uniref:Condensin subunit ScpB n=1 Tax=Salinicoccus kekensis TaxID=714307 RepID=A0A285UDX6_9STAP|nr:SMC-Scp complex subunit ScpB [Salinicoccus kekensis]SOC38786.1 condensin subunit ScpB [Salinicoccus kekensis]